MHERVGMRICRKVGVVSVSVFVLACERMCANICGRVYEHVWA